MGKIWIEWEEWYKIYTNKIGRRRVKLKERENDEKCNDEVESSGGSKVERRKWKKRLSVTVGVD